jgi:metal-responsive CopG/Arc/MetJ family transcriptional regulator
MKESSRITIDIPASIHKKFKAFAASRGKSMRSMVVEYINKQITVPEEECTETHIPNAKTRKALENIKKGKNLVRCKDVKDLLKKLGL